MGWGEAIETGVDFASDAYEFGQEVGVFGGSSGGSGSAAPPFPYSEAQVVAMFRERPGVANEVRSYILRENLTGGPSGPDRVNESSLQDLGTLAFQARYLAEGAPGDWKNPETEFTPKEQHVRNLLMQGFRNTGRLDTTEPQDPSLTDRARQAGQRIEEFGEDVQAAVSGGEAGVAGQRVQRSVAGFLNTPGGLALAALGGFAIFRALS